MYLDNERRPTLTPQLAFRVAVIGGVALVMFAVIFFRLWYLQVLSGDSYVAAARENRVREIKVQAPRGEIVDRHGVPLVENRHSFSIKLSPDKLPRRTARPAGALPAARQAARAEAAPGWSARVERELKALPYSKPTVKQDVGPNYLAYILERQDEFPGVEPESEFLRAVPARRDRRAPVRPGRRGEPQGAEGRRASTACRWATAWARRASRPSTTATCAAATARRAWRWTRSASSRRRSTGCSRSRASSCGCRST